MKTCIILGARSEIAVALRSMLEADGWQVWGWNRDIERYPHSAPWRILLTVKWDLILCAIGKVAPVGQWHTQDAGTWDYCVESNVLLPVALLRDLWPNRTPDARVCFLAGSNPNTVMAGYSAYNCGKMALLKVVEQLDAESTDATLFALGPGVTDTKIHNATREAGWPNPRLERAMKDGSFTPMAKIYECLKWCLAQPKDVIGGRNLVVSDPFGPGLAVKMKHNPAMFKLRRME